MRNSYKNQTIPTLLLCCVVAQPAKEIEKRKMLENFILTFSYTIFDAFLPTINEGLYAVPVKSVPELADHYFTALSHSIIHNTSAVPVISCLEA